MGLAGIFALFILFNLMEAWINYVRYGGGTKLDRRLRYKRRLHKALLAADRNENPEEVERIYALVQQYHKR